MIIIKTMLGMGDCIYLRPILKTVPSPNIGLITPWPQVFHDFPRVQFLQPEKTILHSQSDNMKLFKFIPMIGEPDYVLNYDLKRGSALHHFNQILLGYQPKVANCEMPVKQEWKDEAYRFLQTHCPKKPICIIRPNTQRPEWYCWARSPKNEYLQQFVDTYKEQFFFISIANIKPGIEEYEYKIQNCDCYIEKPTLACTFGLFHFASLVVASPSFWMALGPCFNKNMICLFGAGEHPDNILDKRLQNDRVTIVAPHPFHDCHIRERGAYKEIDATVLRNAFEHRVKEALKHVPTEYTTWA